MTTPPGFRWSRTSCRYSSEYSVAAPRTHGWIGSDVMMSNVSRVVCRKCRASSKINSTRGSSKTWWFSFAEVGARARRAPSARSRTRRCARLRDGSTSAPAVTPAPTPTIRIDFAGCGCTSAGTCPSMRSSRMSTSRSDASTLPAMWNWRVPPMCSVTATDEVAPSARYRKLLIESHEFTERPYAISRRAPAGTIAMASAAAITAMPIAGTIGAGRGTDQQQEHARAAAARTSSTAARRGCRDRECRTA